MRKTITKLVSVVLTLAMVFTPLPDNPYVESVKDVKAVDNTVRLPDDTVINATVVPDINLLNALKQIVGGDPSKSITVGDLRKFSNPIDLSEYANYNMIQSLEGLGYARTTDSIDASKLTNVKIIADHEFANCTFSRFGMPANVEEIESCAFEACSNLTTIKLPSTLTKIQREAFLDCKKLDGITIPNNIKKIGDKAFCGCESIKTIKIPDGINASIENSGNENVLGLGTAVFEGCSSLTSVTLGNGMTAIPRNFLAKTTELTSIVIPEKIAAIYEGAFSMSGLTSIDLSKNTAITRVEDDVFSGCKSLSTVKLPNTVTTIGKGTFANCVLLSDFSFINNLPNITSFDSNAFEGCGFVNLTIPSTVVTIGPSAFASNVLLKNLIIEDFKNVKTKMVKTIGRAAFKDCFFLETVVLPKENENNILVTIVIDDYGFHGCRHLHDINFPANLIKIGSYGFASCGKALRSWPVSEAAEYQMTLNDDLATKLNSQNIVGLQEVDLTKCSKITLGTHAFESCVHLDTVKLPAELTEIPDYCFAECGSDLYYAPRATMKSFGNQFIKDEWYLGVKTIQMGNKIKTFGNYAFHNDYCLELDDDGTLPSALVSIGEYCYENCESLGRITLPSNLEFIKKNAFAKTARKASTLDYMDNIKQIHMDAERASKLKFIGENAFEDSCIDQFRMNEKAPLRNISKKAFFDCQYLKKLYLSKEVLWMQSSAIGSCLRLEEVRVFDLCKIEKDAITGGQFDEHFPYDAQVELYANGNHYAIIEDKINKGYFCTTKFTLTVRPVNEKITIKKNKVTNLPVENIDASSNGYYKTVKVGDYMYEYDPNSASLNGELDESLVNAIPSLANFTINAEKKVYEDYNVTDAAIKTNAKTIALKGTKEGKNIVTTVYEAVELILYSKNSLLFKNDYYPSVPYIVDVTTTPCTGITVNQNYYLSKTGNNSKKTITPVFESEDGDEITDKIEWIQQTGADYVTLTPSDDGKTATVQAKNTTFGSSRIKIKAGQVEKTITVVIVQPANSISVDNNDITNDGTGYKLSMIYGTEYELTMRSNFGTQVVEYPDVVEFVSSNSKVVQIVGQPTVDGNKTTCVLRAVGTGSAEIEAKAVAGAHTKKITVNVSSGNLKLLLMDGLGNYLYNGSVINTRTKQGAILSYSFNEELEKYPNIKIESSNSTVATGKANTKNKEITISVFKAGKTTLSIYPESGTKDNGVTFTVSVTPDVKSFLLSYKTIAVGSSDSVFVSMTNVFSQKITTANASQYASITDNKIEFKSSDPTYATVDNYGKVTAKKYDDKHKRITITCNAYSKDGKVVASSQTTITVKKAPVVVKPIKTPSKVKWAKCKGGKKKASLKWKKTANATGYQIQQSFNKKTGYYTVKKITKGTTVKFTVKKLKKKKVYWFKIRAFAQDAKGTVKYGKWSKPKKVKTK
jgi:hypothetical protein